MYYGGDSVKHFIGIKDEEFIRGHVPMTKQEIRILTLAKAMIDDNDIIIDIGAGTGSLSIEAALLAAKGSVYAIEKKAEAISLIKSNVEKFHVNNINVIEGEAPSALKDLPPSDVIFIGGSGSHLGEIIKNADLLLKSKGRFIVNCITLETLHTTLKIMQNKSNYTCEAFTAQINRLNQVGQYHMSEALNPISIITCIKS
ncbi:MAG: precorrin-6Y C5,15-methyltransferase (decarboxylating), CbiT subunit [Firmicutes bacterium]|nr:precorrin-6Y C5,15-methyltransferase (decarboxylating), CbiT subunit [Bacillota bacterium]